MAMVALGSSPPPLPLPSPAALRADGDEEEERELLEDDVRVEVSRVDGGRVDVTTMNDVSCVGAVEGGVKVDVIMLSLLVGGTSTLDEVVGGSSVVVESGMDVMTMLELVKVDIEVTVDESRVLMTVEREVTSVTILVSLCFAIRISAHLKT